MLKSLSADGLNHQSPNPHAAMAFNVRARGLPDKPEWLGG
jgi:hypothetical protein